MLQEYHQALHGRYDGEYDSLLFGFVLPCRRAFAGSMLVRLCESQYAQSNYSTVLNTSGRKKGKALTKKCRRRTFSTQNLQRGNSESSQSTITHVHTLRRNCRHGVGAVVR